MPDPDDDSPFAQLPDPYEEDWQRRQAEREEAFIEAVANAGGTPVVIDPRLGGGIAAELEAETPLTDAEYHEHILGQEVDNRLHSTHQGGALVIGEGDLQLREEALAPGAIRFSVGGGVEVLRFEPDGKAYVQGKLVEQPEEVIHALRWFLFQVNQPNHRTEEAFIGGLQPRSFKVPKYVLGQKLRCPDGFEGSVAVIFHGVSLTETWEVFLHGPRYDDNQVFYGLRNEAGDRALVGEHSAIPVVPTSEPEAKFTRVSVWERLLAEMLSGVNPGT